MVAIVIYTETGDLDSEVIGRYLTEAGADFRIKDVGADAAAKREWEELDGEVTPLVVIDRRQIIRGLDATRLRQLTGQIGC